MVYLKPYMVDEYFWSLTYREFGIAEFEPISRSDFGLCV